MFFFQKSLPIISISHNVPFPVWSLTHKFLFPERPVRTHNIPSLECPFLIIYLSQNGSFPEWERVKDPTHKVLVPDGESQWFVTQRGARELLARIGTVVQRHATLQQKLHQLCVPGTTPSFHHATQFTCCSVLIT